MKSSKILTSAFLLLLCNVSLASNSDHLELSGDYEARTNDTDRLTLCEKEIQILMGRVEVLEHSVAQMMKGQLTGTANNIPNPSAQPYTKNDAMQAMTELDVTQTPKLEPTSEKQSYDLALVALKDNNLEDAQSRFAEFITKYPKSNMLGNAYFWHGETFFKQNSFEKAAINYLKCYKQFPKGAKAPDALLKLAMSLGSMKKTKEACSMLTKLENEFKDRPATSIKRTKDAKNKYGCK